MSLTSERKPSDDTKNMNHLINATKMAIGIPVGKHGIEIRWKRGAALIILSYAVWSHGVCQVSHDTTAALRKRHNLQDLVNLEAERSQLPII